MAFLTKADRDIVSLHSNNQPGPGHYTGVINKTDNIPAYAPFGSTVQRRVKDTIKKEKAHTPGPGSYETSASYDLLQRNRRVNFSSMKGQVADDMFMSSNFKSRIPRFKQPDSNEFLGPGTYDHEGPGKRRNSVGNGSFSHRNPVVEDIIVKNRKAIPSIPGKNTNNGYFEIDKNNIVPNINPFQELQKFVGPGYYQAKDLIGANKDKGLNWSKNISDRFDNYEYIKPTGPHVGPGSYQGDHSGTNQPRTSKRNSVNTFESSIRDQNARKKALKQRSISVQPGLRSGAGPLPEPMINERLNNMMEGMQENADYEIIQEIEDIAPGPGHYYNPNLSSSMKVSYKPPRLQFFESRVERFQEPHSSTSAVLGPGVYQDRHKSAPARKVVNKAVPFGSYNERAVKNSSKGFKIPGPGTYELKQRIIDKIEEKAKSGYIGSFGSTDRRFKKIERTTTETLGPGTYDNTIKKSEHQENQHKREHGVFHSKTERDGHSYIPLNKEEKPNVGQYNLDYYDLANKVKKMNSNPRKPAFNVTTLRFREVSQYEGAGSIPEEAEEYLRNNTYVLKSRTNNKMSSSFASQTKKKCNTSYANDIPGVGEYGKNAGMQWGHRSHNINYM